MRLPVVGSTGVGRSMPRLAVAVVMSSFSWRSRNQRSRNVRSALGRHQFAVVQPPVPLRIVLGETVVNISAAGPVLGLLLPEERAVLHRLLAPHGAACVAAHMRPRIGIILLDGAGGS